jgi:hypothetical protein
MNDLYAYYFYLEELDMERLLKICTDVWPMLTEEEQASFAYDTGLIGFIELMACVIHFDAESLSADEMDRILQHLY